MHWYLYHCPKSFVHVCCVCVYACVSFSEKSPLRLLKTNLQQNDCLPQNSHASSFFHASFSFSCAYVSSNAFDHRNRYQNPTIQHVFFFSCTGAPKQRNLHCRSRKSCSTVHYHQITLILPKMSDVVSWTSFSRITNKNHTFSLQCNAIKIRTKQYVRTERSFCKEWMNECSSSSSTEMTSGNANEWMIEQVYCLWLFVFIWQPWINYIPVQTVNAPSFIAVDGENKKKFFDRKCFVSTTFCQCQNQMCFCIASCMCCVIFN